MTTGQRWWDESLPPAAYAASKVPLITAYFWIIKLLTTAMGEATSDYMVRAMNPVIAVCLGAIGFAISMVLQFRAKRYVPWIYWLAVAMVAVFGTMAADVLHIKFHIPYAASTVFFAVVLTVVFILWYRSEGTLSIHSIRTPRRELFYWTTVLSTFALGTATGDLTARTLGLGYLASGFLFTVAIAVPLVAHWRFGMNPILAFWIAYVLTRPVGASFADYVAFPQSVGGLNAGHGTVALFLTFLIVIFVGYVTVTRKDVEEVAEVTHSAARSLKSTGAVRSGPRRTGAIRSATGGTGAGARKNTGVARSGPGSTGAGRSRPGSTGTRPGRSTGTGGASRSRPGGPGATRSPRTRPGPSTRRRGSRRRGSSPGTSGSPGRRRLAVGLAGRREAGRTVRGLA